MRSIRDWVIAVGFFAIGVIFGSLTTSRAQQPAAPSPEVQALQAKLMQELNASLQCTTQAIGLQQQLVAVQAEVKALKDKYEPKDK